MKSPESRGRRVWLLAASAVSMAAASCTDAPSKQGLPRPVGPPVITVTMREYAFELSGPLPAGRVIFRMVNEGREVHRPSLLALDDDIPPIDVQVRGSERRFIPPFAGVNARLPGAKGTFAVNLEPGRRYAFVCFAQAPDGQSHSIKGMTWESRAGSGGGTTPTTPTTGTRP